jgi:curved DNA-binding protein
MAFIDYYKILGLNKDATEADIKKAYRKLARKYHPDLNPNNKEAEARFKELNEANEVLSNAENRKKYDQHGAEWKNADAYEKARQASQSQQNPFERNARQGSSGDFSESDYSDFFSSMFGGGNQRAESRNVKFRGQDYNAVLKLVLKDVYETHQRTLTVNGKNIRLTIPAGVKDGQIIKISGHGGPGENGGPNGDLLLTFEIENNTHFKRDNENLYATVNLEVYTAVLGGEITIDTIDSKVKLTVKPETQNGTKVKLKGKGFPVYKKEGEFGDLIITYNLQIPTNLTDKEKELFTELSKLRNQS